ncbi:MAG: (2Fe-2S)-binding protein [Desulfobacterales bacterium]|jgi:bacterioferritin-associated ferredoxin
MAKVFIFAEQIRSIVRSGLKEIEIPEGARISSAAADLIKEHYIEVKTVAPGKTPSAGAPDADRKSAATARRPERQKQTEPQADRTQSGGSPTKTAEISPEELEEIVDRVLERFAQLEGRTEEKTSAEQRPQPADAKEKAADSDDLVICRCEEITRGEIKDAIRNGIHTLNGIKRITRAGMGLCQGQTCQQLVARILADELGLSPADIDPTTARGPVRPLRLAVFANS